MTRAPRTGGSGNAPAPRRAGLPLLLAAALVVLLGAATLWLMARSPAAEVAASTEVEVELEPIDPLPEAPPPDSVLLPLQRIDRLVPVGARGACALGGREAVCSGDEGLSWDLVFELPSRILALVPAAEAGLLAATEDGSIHSIDPTGVSKLERQPMDDRSVVDGVASDGKLYLLAHGFDRPVDPLRLPRVVETTLLALGPDGDLEEVGAAKGFIGDRLLVQPNGHVLTFASVDARAWKSTDGGKTFRRLKDGTRFGADYGGLQIAVERWTLRLPGPGRPARPASALYVSRDEGESWNHVFDTNGETIVDFRDQQIGLVVARDEATAWLTTDGAEGFAPVRRDDLLLRTVAVTHVGSRFLVATSDGNVLLISSEADG